jgi:hypothetical protein
MSNAPSALDEFRELIRQQRAWLFVPGYKEMEAGEYVTFQVDPDAYRHLWTLWRSYFPLHGPPPEPPTVRTRAEANRALDALLRKLDELFGSADPGEYLGACPLETPPKASGEEEPPPPRSTEGPFVPASLAAKMFETTTPNISKWVRQGVIRSRPPTDLDKKDHGSRIRLMVAVEDVQRVAKERLNTSRRER